MSVFEVISSESNRIMSITISSSDLTSSYLVEYASQKPVHTSGVSETSRDLQIFEVKFIKFE